MNKAVLALLFMAGAGAVMAQTPPQPLKVLLITGGCCHDYDRQRDILPAAVETYSTLPVQWTIVHQRTKAVQETIEIYTNPDWAKGYDVVVHNECFAGEGDAAYIAGILQPHINGVPAVMIHCAMHSYRQGPAGGQWRELCGAYSPKHGPHHPFEVQILEPGHEIMWGLTDWTTPKGELYYIEQIFPGVVPLAHAKSDETGAMHVNIWAQEYGPNKTRVFATTIGHHNETMEDPNYGKMFTRGLLWAAGRNVGDFFITSE